jgi:hypothetical protein
MAVQVEEQEEVVLLMVLLEQATHQANHQPVGMALLLLRIKEIMAGTQLVLPELAPEAVAAVLLLLAVQAQLLLEAIPQVVAVLVKHQLSLVHP